MKYNLVFSKNKDGQTSKSIADPTATDDNDKGQSSASTLEPMSESSKTEISSTCRFANNFWSDDDKGVVVLTRKLQNAKHTMANIHRVMAARAQLEEEYGKKLLKLSRNTLGQEELGLHCFRNELESSANTHIKLSKQIRDDLIKPLAAFIEQQRQKRKQQLAIVDRSSRNRSALRAHLGKLRERKNTETARRIELERLVISMQEMVDPKVRQKLEKAQISSQNSERDYKETLRKLDESEGQWVSAWQSACDVFQVLEEERIDYLKTKLWEYTNLISSICVSDDESMERIRQELENVDVECDIEQFIKTFGTGALSRDATGSSSSNSGSTPVGGDSDVPETPLSNRSATQSSGISKPPDHGTASHTSVSDRESSARKAPLTPQQTPHNSLNGQYPQQPLQSGASPAQARPSSGTPTSHHHHQQQQQSIPARPQDSASGAWQARPGTSMQQHPFTHPPPSQQPQQQQQYRRASGNEMYNHAPQPHYSPNSQPYPVDPRAPSSIGSYHQHPDPRVPSSMGHRPPTVSSMYGTNSSATPPSGAYAGGHPPPDNRSIPRHRSSTFNDPGTVGGSLPPGSGQYASLSSSTGVPPHPAYADASTYRGSNSAPSSPVYHHRRTNSGNMVSGSNGASPSRPGSQAYYYPPPQGGHPPPLQQQQHTQPQPHGYAQGYHRTETPLPGGHPYPVRAMTPAGRPPTQQVMHPASYGQPTATPPRYAPSPTPSHTIKTMRTQSSNASMRGSNHPTTVTPAAATATTTTSNSGGGGGTSVHPAAAPVPAATSGSSNRTEDTRPVLFYVRALHDYNAEQPEEISLRERMVISVLETHLDGWWEGEITDSTTGELKRGLFPSNFTEPLEY